ncbi:MAG TPA: hypothetical protein VFO93_05390 [Hymenobacter sp.]|uniref:hypothetical protein n=1 Tax=Hymenobacter sp. TaxID=1898978 RepID=UPI002D7F1033|nr:hypothetical protein [Hymenobacter sp.]HET9502952.1 hypothetical protein [Hymenobacter sp.]
MISLAPPAPVVWAQPILKQTVRPAGTTCATLVVAEIGRPAGRAAQGPARRPLPARQPIAKPPAPPMVTLDLAAFGVKNDARLGADDQLLGGTDNAARLLAQRAAITGRYAFRQQPRLYVRLPAGGVTAYSKNYWANSWRWVIFDLNGGTLKPTPSQNDNYLQRTLNNGELLQIDRDRYHGTKSYLTALKINTVSKGSRVLVVKNPRQLVPSVYYKGARITVYSREVVLGESAYPPGTTHNERPLTIAAIDYRTGRLTLDRPLDYEHRADYPENPQTSGGGSGQARILPLDDPRRPYADYAEFRNGTMLSASAAAPSAVAWVANEVVYRNITTHQGGTATEALTSTTFIGGDLGGEFEDDKLNGWVRRQNTRVRGLVSNGGGCRGSAWVGGRSDKSIQLAAPLVDVDGVECWASRYITDVGPKAVAHNADPAVGSYAGFHHTQRYRLRHLKLGATNNTSAYLSPAEFRTVRVTSVDKGRAGFYWDGGRDSPALLVWRGAGVGTRFYTQDGAKIGRATQEVAFVGKTPACTSGTFYVALAGCTPQVGDVYEFSNVLNVLDEGGHTILTPQHPARLYSEETLAWKGNRAPAGAKSRGITLTKSDLRYNEHGAAYFQLRGFPTSVTFKNPTAASGKVKISLLDKANAGYDLCCFALNSTQPRTCSAKGSTGGLSVIKGGEPDLNQYFAGGFNRWAYTCNVFIGNISPAQAPEFSLTLTFDTY